MLSLVIDQVANELKRRIREITPISRFVVFGSRARGDASEESDLDVFIEVPELSADLRRKISEIAWEIGFEEEVVISTFVVTTRSIQTGPMAAHPILKAIQTEGILIE